MRPQTCASLEGTPAKGRSQWSNARCQNLALGVAACPMHNCAGIPCQKSI